MRAQKSAIYHRLQSTQKYLQNFWKCVFVSFVLALALQPQVALAAWTQASGTAGYRFISMSKIGATLYAGRLSNGTGNPGLYQSTDDGASWTPSFGTQFDGWSPQFVTQVGSVLYVGGMKANTAYLSYSTNGGSNWTDLSGVWGTSNNITDIALMNGATFVAAYGQGVYKSTANDGTGWVLSNTGMTALPKKFAQVGTDIFVTDTTNAAGQGGVFKSTDSGATWVRSSSGITGVTGGSVTGLINLNGSLYAAMGNGVWRSQDSGANWTQVNANNSYAFTNNNATLYLAPASGISLYTSTDGANWTSQDVSGITAPRVRHQRC